MGVITKMMQSLTKLLSLISQFLILDITTHHTATYMRKVRLYILLTILQIAALLSEKNHLNHYANKTVGPFPIPKIGQLTTVTRNGCVYLPVLAKKISESY